MNRFTYPVTLTPDVANGGFTVSFRDVPEAITQGETVDECLTEILGKKDVLRFYRSQYNTVLGKARIRQHLYMSNFKSFFEASDIAIVQTAQFGNISWMNA